MLYRLITACCMAFALAAALPASAQNEPAPAVKLWRLDCGTLEWPDFGVFSDTGAYDKTPYLLTDSCYLIQHGEDYLLWDTGLPAALVGQPAISETMTGRLASTIPDQLARIGIAPGAIGRIGISHYHFDHVGQLADFPDATLMIGKGDWEAVKDAGARGIDAAPFAHWLSGDGSVEQVAGDGDVFGDGSVMMIDLPGHTPGHHALLVRLAQMGPVLLSGDLFHASASRANREVPIFNTNRADTLASIDRFERLAEHADATVVIQHEPADVAKLPIFPDYAR